MTKSDIELLTPEEREAWETQNSHGCARILITALRRRVRELEEEREKEYSVEWNWTNSPMRVICGSHTYESASNFLRQAINRTNEYVNPVLRWRYKAILASEWVDAGKES